MITPDWIVPKPPAPTSVPLLCCGRGRLCALATISDRGVLVRIDSDTDPAFWCELMLPGALLRDLLRRVEEA
jgi:hypothetical protein